MRFISKVFWLTQYICVCVCVCDSNTYVDMLILQSLQLDNAVLVRYQLSVYISIV